MVVTGPKPKVLEFTLTRITVLKTLNCDPADAPLEEGHDEIRFRVVLGGGCYYRQQNELGEDVWTGIGDRGPRMGASGRWTEFSRVSVLNLALGLLSDLLPERIPMQERPNGSVVFDLGTV